MSAGIGGATLGIALTKLMDQVQQAIVDARNAGLNLEAEAGREVSLAIENAKNAYSEVLQETMDKVDATASQALTQLTTMVQEVQDRNETALRTTGDRVAQFMVTLPFANLQPQVTHVTPKHFVPSTESYNVTLTFAGVFMFASQASQTPSFSINRRVFRPIANTTQELKFSIPSTVLLSGGTQDKKIVSGELSVPWERSKWWGFWKIAEIASYNITFEVLPASPGKIVFQYVTSRVVVERQRFVSHPSFHLASTREAGNNDQKDVPFTATPHNGWQVVRGTSAAQIYTSQGDFSSPSFVSDDGNRVTYRATTIHHGFGGSSGSIDFVISFDETRNVTIQDSHSLPINLNWGNSLALPQTVGKVIFDAFDGSHTEFTGADLSNRYIKLRNTGGSLVISAVGPALLV